jgi:hypothetical protein
MTIRDRRTEILERMNVVLSGLTITLSNGTIPAGNFVHNLGDLPANKVPGIILLDGDEVSGLPLSPAPGRQAPPRNKMMKMTPEIYVVLDVRKGAQQNKNVGEDLNTARVAVLAAILGDRTIQDICSTGEIVYDGCVTDLARNRTLKGQLGMSITCVYPFIPGELVA